MMMLLKDNGYLISYYGGGLKVWQREGVSEGIRGGLIRGMDGGIRRNGRIGYEKGFYEGNKFHFSNSHNDDGNEYKKKGRRFFQRNKFSIAALLGVCGYSYYDYYRNKHNRIDYDDIFKHLNTITSIEIILDPLNPQSSYAYFTLSTQHNKLWTYIPDHNKFIQSIKDLFQDQSESIPIKINDLNHNKATKSTYLLMTGLFLTFIISTDFLATFFNNNQRIMNHLTKHNHSNSFTSSKAKEYIKGQVKISLKDIAGQKEAKKEIIEFIDFLKNPAKYHNLGAKIPHGALLVGPPGTGKTLLAKAMAGEANVPFFSISGSEFDEMYIGVGPARVRNLFSMAKRRSPCIIFIDELDSVGSKRGIAHDERKKTLNQLLVEMDGFHSNNKVIVLAATNCPDALDIALLRPGRFDRKIELNLPDKQGRADIFKLYLSMIKLNKEKSLEDYAHRLSKITPGFSGADIANLVNEAAIFSARENKESVDMKSFDKASERIMAGFELKKTLSADEKKVVAFHEAGHAIVNWYSNDAFPLVKISIIPRSKGMLGFNMNIPHNSYVHTKETLIAMITGTLGGRLAEEMYLDITTTGASDDLVKANDLARQMVTVYGMSDLGLISYKDTNTDHGLFPKQYSDKREQEIESQITKILTQCTIKAKTILTEKKPELHSLVKALLDKETLNQDDLIKILGKRLKHISSLGKLTDALNTATTLL